MREARIICPERDNSGSDLEVVRLSLARKLCDTFGGCTVSDGQGSWISASGALYREPVKLFDVACEPTKEARIALRRIAQTLKHDARQEAVYLRLPDGTVEFV